MYETEKTYISALQLIEKRIKIIGFKYLDDNQN